MTAPVVFGLAIGLVIGGAVVWSIVAVVNFFTSDARRRRAVLSEETVATLQSALVEWDNRLIEAAGRGHKPAYASSDRRSWPRHLWPETVSRIDRARKELLDFDQFR